METTGDDSSHVAVEQSPQPPVPLGPGKAARPTYAPDGRGWLFVADMLTLASATLLTTALQRPLGIAEFGFNGQTRIAHVLVLVLFDVLVVLNLGRSHQYQEGRRFSRIDDVTTVVRASFLAAAVATFVTVATEGFFQEPAYYSRPFLVLGMGAPVVMLMVSRWVGWRRQVAAFAEGRYLARALVLGGGPRAERFTEWITAHPYLGIKVYGSSVAAADGDLGRFMDELSAELAAIEPDQIVLALEHPLPELRAAVVREAAYRNVAVRVLPEVFESYTDMPLSAYDGVPVTTVFESSRDRFGHALKRGIDLFGSWFGLIFLSPLFALIALSIWLEDRGPVFYSQERVGERGKRFLVHKFRTMHVDAEARLAELRDSNEAQGPMFKMKRDPRITRVGRVLRRLSLDEFPQLWNVASGEMSLIGPRPPLPTEVDEYKVEHRRRIMVRPGMTGLWQVSGRSETTFDEMVELDLMYIANWSFWLDLKILVRTVAVVLGRQGAY